MSNINFARIAGAPPSPFLEEVRKARAALLQERRDHMDVQIIITDDETPITIWMQRGFEGSAFTYLVTDGTPVLGELTANQCVIDDGTFVLEIVEAWLRITTIKAYVRRGCDLQQVQALIRSAYETRCELRRTSKSAPDEERTIEMVIKKVQK